MAGTGGTVGEGAVTPPVFAMPVPDLSLARQGNTGTAGVWHFDSGRPGRSLMVSALVHGNELCGAWLVHDVLAAGLRPQCGAWTLVLAHLEAFDRFDPRHPDRARAVDTDLNRLWGAMPWQAAPTAREHHRVLELLPWVQRCEWLLDLHSMHEPGPPLGLVGPLPRHATQARQLGAPALLVADQGHRAGTRLRDHGRFGDARDADAFALLVECGWHGDPQARAVARDAFARFVAASGTLPPSALPAGWVCPAPQAPRLLQVTHAVAVVEGEPPRLTQAWRSGQCVPRSGTPIGHDGAQPVLTPYDDCVLIMPTLRHAHPGATLVRLAHAVP